MGPTTGIPRASPRAATCSERKNAEGASGCEAAPQWEEAPLGIARELVHLPAASWLARRRPKRRKHSPVLAAGCADEAAPLIERELRSLATAARKAGATVRTLAGDTATFAAFAEAVPDARVVSLDALADAVPADAARVDPAARKVQLGTRRAAVARRFRR